MPVTFNVVDTRRFKLGFLLGMDVLKRYHFHIDVRQHSVLFDEIVFPVDKILEARKHRDQQLASASTSQVTSVSGEVESDDGRQQPAGLSVGQRSVRVRVDEQVLVPAFSKLMVKGIFPNDEHSNELDLSTADWVYLPLDRDDKLAKPLRDLTCWPGLTKAQFGQLQGTLECPCTWSTPRASRVT